MSVYDPSDPPPSTPVIKTSPDYIDENVNLELVEEGLDVAEDEAHQAALDSTIDPDPEVAADDTDANVPVVGDDPSPETSAMNLRRSP